MIAHSKKLAPLGGPHEGIFRALEGVGEAFHVTEGVATRSPAAPFSTVGEKERLEGGELAVFSQGKVGTCGITTIRVGFQRNIC